MSTDTPRKLKICFHSMDGIGHLAACVGVIQPLLARGHDVFFILNSTFAGRAQKYGVREVQVNKKPSPAGEDMSKASDIGKKMVSTGFLSGVNSTEKMRLLEALGFHKHLGEALVEFDPQITEIIEREKPDLLVVDHFMMPASYVVSGIPFVMIHSCSPLLIYNNPLLPPPFSGFPTKSDPSTWNDFIREAIPLFFEPFNRYQQLAFKNVGLNIDVKTYVYMSPYLNVYAYPKEMDYTDLFPAPENSFRIDAFSRDATEEEKAALDIPDSFINRDKDVGLIYFSMGSMGGADIELMQRYVSWFKETKHKFIVAKGPRAAEYELTGDNCFSGDFLPQTEVLPFVDLVITHGGNNTTTETIFVGKPMIVLPLFVDQYDNGTRIEECRFGLQFNPYEVTKQQMLTAIDDLLYDQDLKQRLAKVRERIVRDRSKEKLADKFEQIALEGPKNIN